MPPSAARNFLRGGGEMGQLIREQEWSNHPLGPPEHWPSALKTTLRLLLNTGHPMYIWWGPELFCFYNDAYCQSIGPELHPSSLGRPGREVWSEIWDIIGPQVDQVMSGGGATWNVNALVPITRFGKREDVYWTYSYSPIDDELAPNSVGGVLVVCTETTQTVLAERRRAEEADRQRRLFEQAPGFIIIMRGPDHIVEFVNDAHKHLFGSDDWTGRPIAEAFPSIAGQGFFKLLDGVFATGETYHADAVDVTFQRNPGKLSETRALTFIYAPLHDEQGQVSGIFCEGFDVTGNRHAQVRQGALAELADAIREIDDPEEIAYRAAEILGRTLQVSRAGYGTIHTPTETITIDRDWNAPGIESLAGVLKFRDYGSYIDDIKAGRTAIVADAETDPRTSTTAASLKAISARSFVNMPITEQGDSVALLFLNHAEPREWQSEELDLIREFAERTRSAVARRNAEIALRESERRLTFLDELGRATAPAPDADTILAITTRMVAEHLGLSNCAYADMDEDEDGFTIRGDWAAPGSPTIVGHYSLADFGTLAVQELGAGRPLIINDNLAELLPEEAQTFQDIGIAATICMPLVKEGRLTALMAIHDKIPRKWSEYDLAIIEEVTERSWAHVERVRSEARLRDSEERLRLAVDNAEVGFWDVDELNDQLVWPARTKAMFGISPDVPVTMQDFYDGLHPEDRDATGAAYAAAADPARRALYDVEYRTVGKEDGIVRWVAAKGRGIFEGEGAAARCLRVTGTAIEITTRKAAEERLRDLNETLEKRVAEVLAERKTFADIVEGTDAFVQVADLEFRWLAINKAAAQEFERIYGIRPRVGDSMLQLLSGMPEHQKAVEAVWARALSGEAFTEIAEFGDPVRERRHYEMKYNPLRNAEGELIGAYQFVYDVTDRIAEQRRLTDAEEALRHSQKMEAMGQLTGGVAHDFNNLLTPIVGSLDMLQRKRLGTEREQRLIAGAAQSADRAKTLVQRLLAFARRQPLQAVAVDVCKLVAGIADLVSSTTGPQIKVVVDVADDLPAAKADPNQLEMALLNLSVNARDAMPEGGTLRISARGETIRPQQKANVPAGAYVCLSVADTGVGMDETTLARAVEPFFSTKGIGKGTGLGLSMVHGLASQLGGTLTLQSRPGLGTNVELWLPQTEELPEVTESAPDNIVTEGQGTALLVDDEELVRLSTADMLNDLGYAVIEAASAEVALELLRSGERFDVLITDHLMPGMNGTDLARAIRTAKPDIPVLIVSGYAEREGIEVDFPRLAKPFRKDELAESLAQLSAIA